MAVNPMTGEVTKTKYRKKGSLVTVTRRTICRVRDLATGAEFDLDEAAFDREYEPVEENQAEPDIVYICRRCGAHLYDGLRDVVMHRGGLYCQGCYQDIVEEPHYHCRSCRLDFPRADVVKDFYQEGSWRWRCKTCAGVATKPLATVVCQRCGRTLLKCGAHVYGTTSLGATLYVCTPCFYDRPEEKKPTSLTLADLKPGDVFRFLECMFCQEEHQLLRAVELWCPTKGSEAIDHPGVRVERLRHHPITPKQQLWIDATAEERKALEESIRDKWLPRVKGEDATGKCALCALHGRYESGTMACRRCILRRAGERCEGDDSPWRRWKGASEQYDDARWAVGTSEQYARTRNMALSLAAYLPNIHPLRIEVEATPEEWPGKK